jgi:RNA polymerase sigma-70 factor (ECF subfamily)
MSDPRRTPGLSPVHIDSSSGASTEDAGRPGLSGREEQELLQRLRSGDEAAFVTLIDRHHGALLRLAQVFLSSRAVAEEVVQETWTGVVEGLVSFEGRSSLKTWIFRILSNKAKSRMVREGRSVPFSALGDADAQAPSAVDPDRFDSTGEWAAPPQRWDDETPERLMIRSEGLEFLRGAIEKLPQNQRLVVTLRDVDGLDSEEVCSILQISETNQRVILHRARSRLRREWETYLGGA